MAKKTIKQEIMQSIANSQVQQVLAEQQQKEIDALQADFAAFQQQQMNPEALMADFNNWKSTQQPTQPVSEVAPKIPTLKETPKVAFREGKSGKANAELQNKKRQQQKAYQEDYQRQQQEEQYLATKGFAEQKKYNDAVKASAVSRMGEEDTSALMDYIRDENLKKNQQKQQDAMLVGGGINQLPGLDDAIAAANDPSVPKYEQPLTPEEADLEKAILNVGNYVEQDVPQLTPEQQAQEAQILASDDYQWNKPSDISTLEALGLGISKAPFTVSKLIADSITNAGDIVGQGSNYLIGNEEKAEENKQFWQSEKDLVNENYQDIKNAQKKAQEEHPFAYGSGNFATQAAMYYVTGPVFDGIAEGAGVTSELTKFFINQGAQNVQDLVLDTAPLVYDLMADGSLSKDEKKEIFNNILFNAAGNAVFGGVSEIPNIKAWSEARDAANAAFRENAQEGAEKLAKLADDGPIFKDETIPVVDAAKSVPTDDIDELVQTATKQSEDAVQKIDDLSKQLNDLANQADNTPVRPGSTAPVSPAIENYAEDLSKAMDAEEIAAETVAKTRANIPDDVQELISSDFMDIYRVMDSMQEAAEKTGDKVAIEKFNDFKDAVFKYEDTVWKSDNLEEVNKAKKAADAANKRFVRQMQKVDPNYKAPAIGRNLGRPEYRRATIAQSEADAQYLADTFIQTENELKQGAFFDGGTPGADPLQTFAKGASDEEWKISKARTNSFEKLGWGKDMPEEHYAYRVFHEAEQRALAAERYSDVDDVAKELLNKNYDEFDEADIKAIYSEMQRLEDQGDIESLKMVDRLGQKTAAVERESGRILQATQEFTRDSLGGALQDAHRAEEDLILEPWRSRNAKQKDGNSRIAKALSDMGHKSDAKIKPELTHDQIKKGVVAELNKEFGSVEQYFSDKDIEFLTTLAEDKSIPVWQITSEIEHKLKTGDWYTLDESIPLPQPTNKKLQSALNSLVTEKIRVETPAPTFNQIREEVKNTLAKEFADVSGTFTDADIDYLANLISSGATREELADALDLKLATGKWGISDETLEEVNNIFKQISQYDPNSKQFVEGQLEAYRLLANEVVPNATALEKFEAWRYMAMLGNPKTMLRNTIGNLTFNVVTGVSNNIAALGEAGIDKAIKAAGGEGIQRTKSVLNPVADAELIKTSFADANNSRFRQLTGAKYEKMDRNALSKAKSVFNSKPMQAYEKFVDWGINDYPAARAKYSTSLAGYLKANGYDTSIFDAEVKLDRLKELADQRLLTDAEKASMEQLTKDVAELNKARDYAVKQAEYATFHEDNAIAKVLSKWSRTSKEEGKGIGHMLIEGIVPFKKTPANVLKSGYEYSPLGVIDSAKKTLKFGYENTGKRAANLADVYKNRAGKDVMRTTAADVIDSWSKTLTGTGLTALGFYLFNKGILHASDPDTQYQDQLEGHQNYALEINGKSYTIDWAAPAVMPLMIGAEAAKLWNAAGEDGADFLNNADAYLNMANRIADPLVETSMLSGVKDSLETAANAAQYNENLNIPTMLAYNTLTGYASQGIPTIAGQIARTVDPTRRSTYTDKEGIAGTLDKQIKKQMNKIPGLSTLNQPYLDTYGREQQNSPFDNPLANLAYQMFSPGYLADINETSADAMSREAYDVSNTESTLPDFKSYFKDSDGKRVTPEEYTAMAKVYGQTNYDVRNALASADWYKELDGPAKEEIVKSINGLSEHVAKASVDPEYTTTSGSYLAYKNGGIDGLMEYYKEENAKSVAKEAGVSTSSAAGKAITQDVLNGDTEAAEQKADAATQLQELGLTKPGPIATYYKAQDAIPSLTPEEFAKTYNAMDKDHNQGLKKKDEVLPYMNSQNMSYAEGMRFWKAYANEKWKIPELKDGTWK